VSTPTHVLYLHGFRSSPLSTKARRLSQWMHQHAPAVHWWCPQLPPSPKLALSLLLEGVAHWPAAQTAVIGSSLGGYYATVVAQRLGCKAVVMNPAVHPARDLLRHIGTQTQYHRPEENFEFRREYVEELQAMQVGALVRPERTLAIIAQGDELLDWREMTTRYAGCKQRVIKGSDHALSDFEAHLPALLNFLELPSP
jgi:uncharacterized protein